MELDFFECKIVFKMDGMVDYVYVLDWLDVYKLIEEFMI